MALIECDECGKQVSEKAAACPNCGAPVERKQVYAEDGVPAYIPPEQKDASGMPKAISNEVPATIVVVT